MAHLAIYRKWRPMTFDDIVGQQHITRTLKNQILSGNVGHAYLFCGTRGTGKTTCAKVFARAVNCLDPQNGNPCNKCDVCRGIIDGSIMDVTEMDAASNNGVDDIRDIKEDINYVASNSKYTVYIIDEVHMLSTSAFNALLKTLEEPPENVIFILATTESHKVPQTILSRCQRFDFKRIRTEDVIVRMKEIAHADGYDISDDAYRVLAQLADGSMRDGLSIMERVVTSCEGRVEEQDVTDILGISTQESVFKLTDAIINGDSAAVIGIIDKTLADGKDLTQLANSMLSHFRSLMICKLSQAPDGILDCDSKLLVKYKAQSERLAFEKINHASSLIANAINDARLANNARIIYELAFIKLTRPEIDRSDEAVMDRLATIEAKLKFGVQPTQAAPATAISTDNAEFEKRLQAVEKAISHGVELIKPQEEDEKKKSDKPVSARLYVPIPKDELSYNYPTAKLARNWSNTVNLMLQHKNPYAVPLKNCVVTFDAEGIVVLVPEDRMFTQRLSIEHIDEIRELFKDVTGTDYNIKIVKREDIDDAYILNPFDLPDIGEPEEDVAEPTSQKAAEPTLREKQSDGFDEFIKKFSDIIIDADHTFDNFDSSAEQGEQTSFDDDDREEFLEANELPSDDEDD